MTPCGTVIALTTAEQPVPQVFFKYGLHFLLFGTLPVDLDCFYMGTIFKSSLVILLFIIVIYIIDIPITGSLSVWKPEQHCSGVDAPESSVRACPADWIYYEGKCYFFSEEKGSWASSQIYCRSYDSTLAVIESKREETFILRYMGTTDHWIGLRRNSGQTWKWTDGTEFKNTLEVRGENGDCAYLTTGLAMSSPCQGTRKWICSQPDTYTRDKGCVRG